MRCPVKNCPFVTDLTPGVLMRHLEEKHTEVWPGDPCQYPGCQSNDRMTRAALEVHGKLAHASASGTFGCPVEGCPQGSEATTYPSWNSFLRHLELMHESDHEDYQPAGLSSLSRLSGHKEKCFLPLCPMIIGGTDEARTSHAETYHKSRNGRFFCPIPECPKAQGLGFIYAYYFLVHVQSRHARSPLPSTSSPPTKDHPAASSSGPLNQIRLEASSSRPLTERLGEAPAVNQSISTVGQEPPSVAAGGRTVVQGNSISGKRRRSPVPYGSEQRGLSESDARLHQNLLRYLSSGTDDDPSHEKDKGTEPAVRWD